MMSFSKDPKSPGGEKPGLSLKPWFSEVVAVTGTIGSGKSTVINMLKERGAFVVSADDLAKAVVAPGTIGLQKVVERFGAELLTAEGELDRKRLGRIVFAAPEKKKELEAILHPMISERAKEAFAEAQTQGKTKLVYEVPLLFEAGLDKKGFKKIVVVTASDEVCIERVQKRDKLSEDDAKQRLKSQIPTSQKTSKADLVIDNSRSLKELEAQVDQLFRML